MSTLKNLTGQTFNRLTVIERAENNIGRRAKWRCLCKCGNIKVILAGSLLNGHTQSCGCLNKETASTTRTTHGLTNHRLYNIWTRMKQRCYNYNDVGYKYYGAKGITVCQAWRNSFEIFYNWAMENGYEDGLTIDRIRSDRNYTPSNGQWLTRAENASKQRGSIRSTNKSGHFGVSFCNTYKTWSAKVTTDEGRKHLGTFKSKREAVASITRFQKEI